MIICTEHIDGEFLVAVEFLAEIEVERRTETAHFSFLASLAILPHRIVMCLNLIVRTPELCENIWRELSLESKVVILIIYILEIEILIAVAEMVVTTVEIVGNSGSIGENIRILALAIGVVTILHTIVEGYLVVALVIAHVEVGIVECHPSSLHHVETGGITSIEGLGFDVYKRTHIGIACRWNRVIFHILNLIHGYALEVVIGGLNSIYEYLQRLTSHGVQFACECIEA